MAQDDMVVYTQRDVERIARTVRTVERGLPQSRPHTGQRHAAFLIDDGGVGFTGYFDIDGETIVQLPLPPTQPFVKVDQTLGTAAYDAGPIPAPSPGIRWYRVATTVGDQHL